MQEVRNRYLSGIVVFESGRLWLGKLKTDDVEILSIDATDKDAVSRYGSSPGTREKIAYTDRKGTVWDLGEVALYTTDKTISAAPLSFLRQTVLQALLLVVTLSIFTTIVLNLLLNKPLGRITRTAQRISDGELDLQAEVSGPREIATLATAFNSMTRQLRASMKELARNITKRKKDADEIRRFNETLEERRAQRTAELKAMNEQLEAFGSAAAWSPDDVAFVLHLT